MREASNKKLVLLPVMIKLDEKWSKIIVMLESLERHKGGARLGGRPHVHCHAPKFCVVKIATYTF